MPLNKVAVLGVIPARLGSTRLERKPLQDIAGMSLVERVWRGVCSAQKIDEVVIATDSLDIVKVAEKFSARALMTSEKHKSGTDRVAEILEILKPHSYDVVINIQGDMPFINGEIIDSAIEFFQDNFTEFDVATAAVPIYEESTFLNPANVKVVLSSKNQAMYFSRAPIPFSRDGRHFLSDKQGVTLYGYKHIGLYLFKPQALNKFVSLPPSELEDIEMLEQLRGMQSGLKFGVVILDIPSHNSLVEVDTAEDLERARNSAN